MIYNPNDDNTYMTITYNHDNDYDVLIYNYYDDYDDIVVILTFYH